MSGYTVVIIVMLIMFAAIAIVLVQDDDALAGESTINDEREFRFDSEYPEPEGFQDEESAEPPAISDAQTGEPDLQEPNDNSSSGAGETAASIGRPVSES